ncbi:MAG: SDR family oxidoreductase [Planctomycetes bacterium]|nr:SDR family oxidoreductase [Planctomycetota bacterium]
MGGRRGYRPLVRVTILGCGYVGCAIGERLAAQGQRVVGTTTTPDRQATIAAGGMEPQLLRLDEVPALHRLLSDSDAVVLTVAPGKRGGAYRDVYLAGARSLLLALPLTPVRHLIYTSSTRVYGQDDGSWVTESSPAQPADEAGQVLAATERTLRWGVAALSPGAPGTVCGTALPGCHTIVTVLRLSGIYGPGRDPRPRICAQAGGERHDGEEFVNMIHRDDIVDAVVALLHRPYDGVLNLTDDEPLRRRDYYDRVLAAAGLPPICWTTPQAELYQGKRVSNEGIKQHLGLTLRHPRHAPAA